MAARTAIWTKQHQATARPTFWVFMLRVAAVVLLLGALGAGSSRDTARATSIQAPAGVALSADELDYVNRMNVLRAGLGLKGLTPDPNMESLARAHTAEMVVTQKLDHTVDLVAGVYEPWSKLGENIGFGQNNAAIWAAFVASPPHYHNLINPDYDRVGVAIAIDPSGIQWTTHRFMQSGAPVADTLPPWATTPSTTTPAPTTPAPVPPPTRPPTTIARPATTQATSATPVTASTTTTEAATTSTTTTSVVATTTTARAPSTGPLIAVANDPSQGEPTLLAKLMVLLGVIAMIGAADLMLRFTARH